MAITLIIFFVLVLLDQLSKLFTEYYLALNSTYEFIPNCLYFTKVYNKGAAWSMFEDTTIILVIISFVATIILGYMCSKNDWKKAKISSLSLTLAFAGCVGNFFDRLISVIPGLSEYRPGVVDMIIFKPFDWLCTALNLGTTVFNVADMYLVIGLIIFAIDYIFLAERRAKKNG